ncbi:hypothetical protein ALQ04_01229 [Pseudomonas cichorii]|uniref:Uncharacterized protein n=1 Tax=Pseudomonas cichorii TaxID=36746 RepID=A0A3M4M9C6_PSECI|nr:hypothetical protein [Pseudomonas cichorii]RMQ49854.1 hypothetical protein ALQ04_01229 [Pseudomonas cichorii]
MARKEFNEYEAVSAVVPGEGGYSAAIAVKALNEVGAPRFHRVLPGEKFKTAHDADLAATRELERLTGVDAEAELVWANE